VVTVKLNSEPNKGAAAAALVITGLEAAVVTVRVNAWVAGFPTPLEAVMVIG